MWSSRTPRRRVLALTVATAALAIGACGEGAETDTAAEGQGTEVSAEDVAVSGGTDEKPEIELSGGDPPAGLQSTDVVDGEGDEAQAGATVTTHYVGVSWSNGEQFDASWDREEPISFPLAGVIRGWQEGIPGMRVGGRRILVIPPEQAYGDNPPPGSGIAPGETLVFVIDLVAVD